ncbi:lysophospholipid acyltransferase family protein [Mycolicibacterium helvum]|uniref:Membrane protein n=1 Tax=Mycolicibacterium helvum TaxID=1534349 RepID=A0A7I7SZP3_9MYCO|nr:lysophospholipid acyltransferase family protein [Mycolicibacterium helvum]BBY62534.1 membrane protein [Mycolicibacterium helvum]
MTIPVNLTQVTEQPPRVRALRRALGSLSDTVSPAVDLLQPYVEGTENLPRDGRCLLVGNHTQGGMEVFLISHFVRRAIGTQVRPLAERGIGKIRGPFGDVAAAFGAVVGSPENALELMRRDQTILVFPGGGREIAKFKGEENTFNWRGRSGFARVAITGGYPIVPVGLVGSDEMYHSLISRDSRLGRLSLAASEMITGRADTPMPLMRGIGPTLVPRPQRMYLRFGIPVSTTKPAGVSDDDWVATVKQTTQTSLETTLSDLLKIRADDPYRALNPLAWRHAAHPATEQLPPEQQ